MSLQAHLKMLETKHASLEKEIREESRLNVPNDLIVAHLKKRKLMLKEEISRLREKKQA